MILSVVCFEVTLIVWLTILTWEQGCEGARQARGSRWQMRKQKRKRRDRPLSSFADVPQIRMMFETLILLSCSLGRLFPGSALSEGTTGSENSGHPRMRLKFWGKFTKSVKFDEFSPGVELLSLPSPPPHLPRELCQ